VSEINLGLYRTLLQPWVQMWASEGTAEWMRKLHPVRLQYEIFSRTNPFMRALQPFLAQAEQHRNPVAQTNAFWQAQEWCAELMETSLNAYRDIRDHSYEMMFHAVYGSPVLQALVGLKASDQEQRRKPSEDAMRLAWVARRIRELREGMARGGAREAVIRALLYIRRPEGVADERGFNFLRRMRQEAGEGMSLADFKQLVRDQFFMLLLDERGAVSAIPAMLDREPELAARLGGDLRKLIDVVGVESGPTQQRVGEIERMFKAVIGRHSGRKSAREEREPEAVPAMTHAARGAKQA
jgi:hypothetical protein